MAEEMPSSFKDKSRWYEASVRSISNSAEIIYTYNHSIHGFSARFTSDEVELLVLRPEVLSIAPELQYKLETTRSPFFLGLDDFATPEHFPFNGSIGDVVVGVIDSGVWPESKSFIDKGFGPPPRTWKGKCEEGKNFTALLCNRKLVGARFFVKGYEARMGPIDETKDFRSPRDKDGHGTHTSSTAVGSVVKGANFLGYASGVARGMAPQARVSVYKACWFFGCMGSDVLAAIDQAIEDNVNVLSISLGLGTLDYYKDDLAIGALAATERGIVVSAAAGNYGPSESTLLNVAPWMITVGAGTIDRDFPAMITLDNGNNFSGVSSLFKRSRGLPNKQLPLVYDQFGGDRTGKLVLVDIGSNGINEVNTLERSADALGLIYANTGFNGRDHVARYSLLPSVFIDKRSGDKIRDYILTDSNPTAKIRFKGTIVNIKPSPVVAGFSSRGPNPVTPDILKPDLIAPGVNILAAWTGATEPGSDLRHVEFNIKSGTSMSCPHVSGLVALLKAAHPEWSPAAIRSALMTTAKRNSNDGKQIIDGATGEPSTPFAIGAGHVSPVSALNPGLIYDLTADDYLQFLCASYYTTYQMKIVARRDYVCDQNKSYRISDLNYPSFAITINQSRGGSDGVYVYTRIVTSVGGAGTYTVKVLSDIKAVNISVEPAVLDFNRVNEKKSYSVRFTVNPSMPLRTNSFGSIEWSDGRHVVRSPVALRWI